MLVARLINWDVTERGQLANKMVAYLDGKVQYSVRKLGPAERNKLHVGPGENGAAAEFGDDFSTAEPHPDKGGIRLTPYLTYNCLSISEDRLDDMYMSAMRTFWTCDICDLHMPLTFQEKAQHRKV